MQLDYASQAFKGGQMILDPIKNNIGALWLSGFNFAQDHQKLKKNNINAVLSATQSDHKYPKYINQISLKIQDDQDQVISDQFSIAYQFIQNNRKKTNVLVHCAAGISRSCSIMISYLMKKLNMTYEDAFLMVKKKREFVQPNPGFVQQLKKYEQSLKKDKKKLQQQGQIKKMVQNKPGTIKKVINYSLNKKSVVKPIVEKKSGSVNKKIQVNKVVQIKSKVKK